MALSSAGCPERRFIEYIVWFAASLEYEESRGAALEPVAEPLAAVLPREAAALEAGPRVAARHADLIARAAANTLSNVGWARWIVMF